MDGHFKVSKDGQQPVLRFLAQPPEIGYHVPIESLKAYPEQYIHAVHHQIMSHWKMWLHQQLTKAVVDYVEAQKKQTGIQGGSLGPYVWVDEALAGWKDESDPVGDLKEAYAKYAAPSPTIAVLAQQIQASPITTSALKHAYDGHITAQMVFPESVKSPVPSLLEQAIPGFAQMKEQCPVEKCLDTGHKSDTTELKTTIIHLNDYHGWSREDIADWLETLDHDLRFTDPNKEEDAA